MIDEQEPDFTEDDDESTDIPAVRSAPTASLNGKATKDPLKKTLLMKELRAVQASLDEFLERNGIRDLSLRKEADQIVTVGFIKMISPLDTTVRKLKHKLELLTTRTNKKFPAPAQTPAEPQLGVPAVDPRALRSPKPASAPPPVQNRTETAVRERAVAKPARGEPKPPSIPASPPIKIMQAAADANLEQALRNADEPTDEELVALMAEFNRTH